MSTDIQAGKIPANITSSNSHRNLKTAEQKPNSASTQSEQVKMADTVSMTDKVSRLQEIENLLAAIPPVNDTLVAEMGQAIADGNLEIDLSRIASKLIEIETGVADSEQSE